MSNEPRTITWEPIGRMRSLEKLVKLQRTDTCKIEVGLTFDATQGRTTRILVEMQRDINGTVYYYSDVMHPRDVQSGETMDKFRTAAAEFFDQMRRKECGSELKT